ncbi:MAG: hypothetical protein N3A38_02125, partial [Planctomycetota bacterium]|nr:hypothetical protein [Planctomycetota bacterium]
MKFAELALVLSGLLAAAARRSWPLFPALATAFLPSSGAKAEAAEAPGGPKIWQSTEAEDYTIKRKEVFEFAKKPEVTREGDRVTIRFASRDYCDATVVIERGDGTIVRHLASGVLGPNAPDPFQPNSLEQIVVWDGKNDAGEYIDDKDALTVRVSLGLKARFERSLLWHPMKRLAGTRNPRPVAQPEGVYVYEGGGVENVKLFAHDGKYIRTIFPFPADKVDQVNGLEMSTFADGHKVPTLQGWWAATYLPSGCGFTEATWGTAARTFAVHDGRIAVVPGWDSRHTKDRDLRLARFRTDGKPGSSPLIGPKIDLPEIPSAQYAPRYAFHSAAFSPDGKWLYLTGTYKNVQPNFMTHPPYAAWMHAVYRMEYDGQESPKLWLGGMNPGKGEKEFHCPAWVCVDAQGRVYIADNHNDRVQ